MAGRVLRLDLSQVDGRCRRRAGRPRSVRGHRSVPRVVRVEAVQREDRPPGRQIARSTGSGVAVPAATARTPASTSSVIARGTSRPGRRAAASARQAGGVGVAGSSGSPVAIASRCVQARGTTSTSAYPPPPVATQRPVAELVGEVAQRQVARPAARRRTAAGRPAGRAGGVSAPHWVNSTCGPERAQHRRHHRVERAQPAGVVGAGRQRHVDRACPRRPRRRSRPGSRCRGTAPAASRAG